MLWWWYFFFKDCKQPNNIQSFGNDLLCNITDKCTEIICCLFLEKLELSLDFFLTMDPCNNKFTIGVGKLTKSEYLLSFQFGVEEVFSLFGVLKLRFVIICWFRILILCHKRNFYFKLDNTVPRYLDRYNLYAICCLFKMKLKIENLYLGNLKLLKVRWNLFTDELNVFFDIFLSMYISMIFFWLNVHCSNEKGVFIIDLLYKTIISISGTKLMTFKVKKPL